MDRREGVWIVLLLALGAVGLWVFLHFYTEAFPAASLDFKLSREEVFQKAEDYLGNLGYDMEGYESAQVFSRNQMEQIFLEKTLGLEETNRLAREWVSIWTWNVRWFKPLQKEEFRVRLDPGGRIVSFSHRVLESDEGASLAQEAALPIAERFVKEVQGFDLNDYTLIDRSSVERKARTDHTFTYRKAGFTVGEDGHYRLGVVVQGDRVGQFGEYLKVPETFTRKYTEVRSRANLLSQAFAVFWLALAVAMLVVLVKAYRKGTLRWQAGLVVGVLVAVATVAAQMNGLPLISYDYNTTQSYSAFLMVLLLGAIIGSVLSGGIICMTGTAGGALGREVLFGGRRDPLGRFSPGGMLSKGFLRSTLVGYGIAGVMVGYVTLFYLVGSRYFGIWFPADVSEYDNAFSTLIPWIYPLLVGLAASTMEEFFFRLLAIPLLIRWLKRRWLAVLLPAVVWAFLHSNYPVEPIYTRGIELTVVGVMFGAAFLRFGIWAPIIAHYAYNAFLTALPMMKSASLYFQVSGIAVTGILLLPAIPALIAFLTGYSREVEETAEEETLEPAVEAPPSQPEEAPQEDALPQKGPEAYLLDRRGRVIAGVFAAVGIALMAGLGVEQFGARTLSLSVNRAEAIGKAEAFCDKVGLDITGYRRSAQFRSNVGSSHFVHLVRHAGVARADTLASEETAPWTWRVRWFRPLEKEEVQVGVDGAGQVVFFNHIIPEARAGATLDADSARTIARPFVERHFGRSVTDTVRYKLLESRSEKEEARMDHYFIWERIDRKVEDGEFRMSTRVQGDRVGSFGLHYKAPEAFLRELREQKAKDVIPQVVSVVLVLATVVLAGRYFLRAFRERQVRWRFAVWIGVLAAALMLVDRLNDLPTFFQQYDTSQALATFLWGNAIGFLLTPAFTSLMMTLVVALAVALFRALYPHEMAPAGWFGLLRLREGGARFWLDALLLGGTLALIRKGIEQVGLFVNYHWLTDYLKPGGFSPPGLNTYLPVLNELTDAVGGILLILLLTLAVFLVWQQALKRTWLLGLGLIVVGVMVGAVGPAKDLYHFAILAGLNLISWGSLIFLVGWVVRFNLLAYMIALWAPSLIEPGLSLLKVENTFYQANGAAILLLGLAPLALPLIAYLKGRDTSIG